MYVDMFVQIFILSSLTCGFPCHMRSCWNMAADPSGGQGGMWPVQFWDFGGMDSLLQSFRTIKPCER